MYLLWNYCNADKLVTVITCLYVLWKYCNANKIVTIITIITTIMKLYLVLVSLMAPSRN